MTTTSPSWTQPLEQVVDSLARTLQPLIEQTTETLGRATAPIAEFPLIRYATGIPGISWLLAALGQVNPEKVRADVAQLRLNHPLDTPRQLAERVIADSVWKGAQVGLLTNIAPPFAIALLVADVGAVAALQAQMIYRIAAVYGFSADDDTRRGEVLALWLVTSGSSGLLKSGLSLVEIIPGLGTALGIATDASLLYAVGTLAARFYALKGENPATIA